MLRLIRPWAGALFTRRLRRDLARYLVAARDARRIQTETLYRLLALNAGSDFSRERGLWAGMSVAEFRRAIPVSDFETYRPYVERLKQGDTSALLGPKNKLLMFTLSSGTTAESKFIPITDQFLADYRRGWSLWGIQNFDDHPTLHHSDIVQLSSDYDQFRTEGGIPCGNISGLVGAMQSPLVRGMYAVPLEVSKITDPEAKYYTALRLSIANPHVGQVMTANPSTLVHLGKLVDRERDRLIRDIAQGTLDVQDQVPPSVRPAILKCCRPNPSRAKDLERCVEEHGRLAPQHFWPKLALVAVWTGGSAGAYLQSMRRYFGNVAVRDHGLSASEGRMTIPFADHGVGSGGVGEWRSGGVKRNRVDSLYSSTPALPHSSTPLLPTPGLLDVGTHFFEFIPEEEYQSSQPTVLLAHELQAGRDYYILLTTSSGLYRYNIRDVVRCRGFHGTTPLLEFLHKGAHIANLTGEKVSESQVVTAVRTAVERLRLDLSCFTLSPVWDDPPRYRLHFETADVPHPVLVRQLASVVDSELRELNCEYHEKRATGRLEEVQPQPLPEGTWRRFARHRQSRLGGSLEQYKHPCLSPDLSFSETLLGKFAAEALREQDPAAA